MSCHGGFKNRISLSYFCLCLYLREGVIYVAWYVMDTLSHQKLTPSARMYRRGRPAESAVLLWSLFPIHLELIKRLHTCLVLADRFTWCVVWSAYSTRRLRWRPQHFGVVHRAMFAVWGHAGYSHSLQSDTHKFQEDKPTTTSYSP